MSLARPRYDSSRSSLHSKARQYFVYKKRPQHGVHVGVMKRVSLERKEKGGRVQAPDRFTMANSDRNYFLLFCSAAQQDLQTIPAPVLVPVPPALEPILPAGPARCAGRPMTSVGIRFSLLPIEKNRPCSAKLTRTQKRACDHPHVLLCE